MLRSLYVGDLPLHHYSHFLNKAIGQAAWPINWNTGPNALANQAESAFNSWPDWIKRAINFICAFYAHAIP